MIVGILNSYEEFTVPALMPVLWNLTIIVGLLVFVPAFESEEAQLYVYAGGILAGTIIQAITPSGGCGVATVASARCSTSATRRSSGCWR